MGRGQQHHFGNDPEIFVLDGKGQVLPAFSFLPSKHEAVATGGQKIFWDGFQAEFTTRSTTCFGWGGDYVQAGLKAIHNAARKVCKDAKITWKPVVDIPKDMLANSHPDCVALGCDPSQNAYFEGPNEALAQLDAHTLSYRFAGYHVHMGIGKVTDITYKKIIRRCDAIAGVISVCLFRGMEDQRRRKYYGLAGEYRTPPHGLEWRTLSSCVLCSPYTFHLMSDLTRLSMMISRWKMGWVWKADEKEVRRAIDELDVDLAWKILTDNKDALRVILNTLYPFCKDTKTGYDKVMVLLEKGALNTLDTDIESSWRLNAEWRNHSHDSLATIYGLSL
jgi:hypothetical protein